MHGRLAGLEGPRRFDRLALPPPVTSGPYHDTLANELDFLCGTSQRECSKTQYMGASYFCPILLAEEVAGTTQILRRGSPPPWKGEQMVIFTPCLSCLWGLVRDAVATGIKCHKHCYLLPF